MSDPRPGDQGSAVARTSIHDRICNDDAPDRRYAGNMTNKLKVEFVCNVMGYPSKVFDLELPFPVEDWLASDDNSKVVSGLYLNDLRVQFFSDLAETGPEAKQRVWKPLAEAEFWKFQFNNMLHRRMHGQVLRDNRVLH